MPRNSSSSKPSGPKFSAPAKIYPAPPSFSPPAAISVQGPTLGQSIKDGVGLGIGSAIGHRIVGSFFGPPTIQTVPTAPTFPTIPPPCTDYEKLKREMDKCLIAPVDGVDCSRHIHAYQECLHPPLHR